MRVPEHDPAPRRVARFQARTSAGCAEDAVMVEVACPRCRELVLPGAHYCPSCGLDVSGPQGILTTVHVPVPADAHRVAQAELLGLLRDATLGEYDVVGELGRGGMATVYLAHDIALDRHVAIKVMHPGIVLGEGMVDRFKREARTAAALTHPHIIPIHLVRETPRILFFVMKYVEGRGLDSILAEQGPLPIKMVQTILMQVGGALGYAHRRGVVHRDVKPANVMIDSEGWAAVTDFGIAKVAEAGSLTMSGATVGTPAYMSPEQCTARPVTGASDQYSLGIVAFEMLTGKPPFVGETLMDLMRRHFFEAPPPLYLTRPDCPAPLAAAIARMLAKEPGQRWPSMEDAVGAIGVPALGHDDPVRTQMIELAKTGIKPVARIPVPHSPTPLGRPSLLASREASTVGAKRPVGRPGATRAPPRRRPRRRRTSALVWGSTVVIVATAALGLRQLFRRGPEVRPAATVGAAVDSVATVEIVGAPRDLVAGQVARLTARARNPAGDTVPAATIQWSTPDNDVARVSSDGLVTGVGVGSATIMAASDGQRDTIRLRVTRPAAAPRPSIAAVAVTPSSARLRVGASLQLRAEPRDATGQIVSGRSVAWESSHPTIAQVSLTGRLTGVSPGTASVTATVGGVTSHRATISVEQPAAVALGVLRLLITPWANVSIDGRSRGPRDRLEVTLAAGAPHLVRLERAGFVTFDTTVTLDAGEVRLLRIQLRGTP